MDDFELIFNMLGERATTEIHRNEDSRGTNKLKADSHAGGKIAGDARKALEKRLKRPIVSSHNYLKEKESQKKLPQKYARTPRRHEGTEKSLVQNP
jgi:DNA-damage-inducible protein D